MLTCLENTGLFLAWMKAALPAIQPQSLLSAVGPKAPANNVVFLVLALSFTHIFFSQKPRRSSGCCLIRLYTPLGFCSVFA